MLRKKIRCGNTNYLNATYRFDTYGLELRAIKIFGRASDLLKVHGAINSHFPSVNLRQIIEHYATEIMEKTQTCMILLRESSFGSGNSIFLSILPDRNNAGSRTSTRFVAAITLTVVSDVKPSN